MSYACYGTSKKNYCLFNNKYIDLFTNEEISEKEANYRVLDDTYGFSLLNNKLVVYENNNIIGEFDNINLYLGGYYFSGRNLGEDGDKLYKLVFNLAN